MEPSPDRGDAPRPRRRLVGTVALIATITLLLYLVLTFAAPQKVPRLVVLPKPAEPSIYQPDCDGTRSVEGRESWERSGPIWTRTRIGGGCLPPP